jgi:aquaporin related protein
MCIVGALPYIRGVLIAFAQILGGITAAAIVSALFPGPLTVQTSLGGGTSITQGLFIEMFLTALLVFTIFMLAAEKHRGTFIAPIGIGLSLFVAELTGLYFTGGSVNPARSFGPSVVARHFYGYHWIYWVGPFLGALLASGFYKFIKMLEYETVNPGQDADQMAIAVAGRLNSDADTLQTRVPSGRDHYHNDLEAGMERSKESGEEKRPYGSSPASPHQNSHIAGFKNGELNSGDLAMEDSSAGSGTTYNHGHIKTASDGSSTTFNYGNINAVREITNEEMGRTPSSGQKSALKSGSLQNDNGIEK